MSETTCTQCGYDHGRLGIELNAGTLYRKARASIHRLRIGGGAWAFAARLIDAHLGEIEAIQIEDTESGAVYCASVYDFQRRSWRTDLGRGEQVILALSDWKIIDPRTGPGEGSQLVESAQESETAQRAEQLKLIPGASSTPGFYYKPASAPRPRRPGPRRLQHKRARSG